MKQQLKFYDLRKKKSFVSNSYVLKMKRTSKGMKYFAVTKIPNSNFESWRIVSKDFFMKNK